MITWNPQKEVPLKRYVYCFGLLFAMLPWVVDAEVVALQLQRPGVKKAEQMVYGVDVGSGQVVWEQRFGEEVNFVQKVQAGVLVGCDDGTLSLVDPKSGALQWSAKLGTKGEKVNEFRGEFANGYLVSFHNEVLWLVSSKGELVWVLR